MAQFGSVFSTPSNQTRASGNQNECSSATAWLKSSFTAGLHDVSKLTVPTWEEDPLCCEWSSCADTTRGTANSANTHATTVSCFVGVLRIKLPVARAAEACQVGNATAGGDR